VKPASATRVGTTPATAVSGGAADITESTTASTPSRSAARVVDETILRMVRRLAGIVNPFDANVLQRFVRSNVPRQHGGVGTSDQTLNQYPILISWWSYIERLLPCLIYPRILEGSGTFCSRIVLLGCTPQLLGGISSFERNTLCGSRFT